MKSAMHRKLITSLPTALIVTGLSTLSGCWSFSGSDEAALAGTTKARIGPLVITSTESGELESERKTVIANELEWSVIIKSVMEEGMLVEKGDLVIEFECKDLITAIEDKELEIENAQMDLEQARKNHQMAIKDQQNLVVQSENALKTAKENKARYARESKSDVAKAEEVLKQAEEALTRYLNEGGKWENDLKDAQMLIAMTRAQLAIAEEKLRFKRQVNSNPSLESPYPKTEIDNDAMNVEKLKDSLEKAIAAKGLLIKYDHPNQKRQLEEDVRQAKLDLSILVDYTIPQTMRLRDSEVVQAELVLEKSKIGKEATLKWGEIEIRGKDKVLKKQQEKLADLLEQKEKLVVKAERDGLILYRLAWGEHGVVLQIKAGTEVNPRQRLIEIPDMTTLQVKTIVFESKNRYVEIRDEDREGSEAMITLDSLPNKELKGHVVRRATLPKIHGHEWMKTGARVYDLYIDVDWEAAGLSVGDQLKPGMKCNVEVTLERMDEALLVPIASVYSNNGHYFSKKVENGKAVEQEVTIGKMNDRDVQILSGLEVGDEILTDAIARSPGARTAEPKKDSL